MEVVIGLTLITLLLKDDDDDDLRKGSNLELKGRQSHSIVWGMNFMFFLSFFLFFFPVKF